MDFGSLGPREEAAKPTHPIEIFEKLPNLPETPNDIWRGQTETLNQWHQNRTAQDILVALNTGGGKTLVGLLIAQSLVNEGVDNVVYVCATIDLVLQTSGEAEKIGLEHTTRIEGDYSNDQFASGRTFCITTYQAIFNALSSIRRNFFPGAVIFDDAHVAESMLRDAYSLRVDGHESPGLFEGLCELFEPHFIELDQRGAFEDAISLEHRRIVMAAPSGVRARREQLYALFEQHGASRDNRFKYNYPHLRDRFDRCAVFFGLGRCEIGPPFLPSPAIDILERPIRRVYLSATLKYQTDFIRAFGRKPDLIIEPRNDAGNGERLILMERAVDGGFNTELVRSISDTNKVLIAVPNYSAAGSWGELGTPPDVAEFSNELNRFRAAENGVFLLVSRVDGIDLPHETCRIMVLDGLPIGSSLLERYLWEFLDMRNLFAARISNRLAQLFGRINRGRNDYGGFLISGNSLNNWLNNDRNLALLPDLLQQQVKLGQYVQEGMKIHNREKVEEVIETVLNRDPEWLKFYADNISKGEVDEDKSDRAKQIEMSLTEAALCEAEYIRAMWEGDIATARNAIDQTIEQTGRADPLLAGWHNVWLGSCYQAEGDNESARLAYRAARQRLGLNLVLPTIAPEADPIDAGAELTSFGAALDSIVSFTSAERYDKQFGRLRSELENLDGATPRQMEESVRVLGEALGFCSLRPDNDVGTGPDVLWLDQDAEEGLAFELKTDKTGPALYSKRDISQGHDHIEWIRREYGEVTLFGLLYVGPEGRCHKAANPSDQMWLNSANSLAEIRDLLLAQIEDIRHSLPLERLARIRDVSAEDRWTLANLSESLFRVRMTDIHDQ